MSVTRLARLVEIPLLERMGYRAVRQRGGLVEMERPEMIDIGPFDGEPDESLSFDDPPSDAKPAVLCTKRKEPADAERLAFEVMANWMGSNI